MDKMIVKVPVTIKAKVTEDLKAQLIADMKRQVQAAELDFERFQFSAKKALDNNAGAAPSWLPACGTRLNTKRTNVAMLSRSLKINWNEQKTLKSVAKSVTAHWSVPWKITIGSDLEALMGAEIVVEDGKVIAFRA